MELNVLVLEDNWAHGLLLEKTLGKFVHNLYLANCAEEMFRTLYDHPEINGLILNVRLKQGIPGTTAYLRLLRRGIKLPAIFLTVLSEFIPPYDSVVSIIEKHSLYDNSSLSDALNKMKNYLIGTGASRTHITDLLVPVVPSDASQSMQNIPANQILYIESFKREKTVHTVSGSYNTMISIVKYEDYLAEGNFYKLSQSCLINLDHAIFAGGSLVFQQGNKELLVDIPEDTYDDLKLQVIRHRPCAM